MSFPDSGDVCLEHAVVGDVAGITLGMIIQLVVFDRGTLAGHAMPVQDLRAGDTPGIVP
jgi:hypothetical protein